MKTKIQTIAINKKHLIFRSQVRQLQKLILSTVKTEPKSRFVLNFSQVSFISRSCADELFNLLAHCKTENINVALAHLAPEIKTLLSAVKKAKQKIKKEMSYEIY